jgi:hypothetical protein
MERLINETICGFPIVKVKKILKNDLFLFISVESINEVLKNNTKSKKLLNDLVESGYIEETKYPDKFMISTRGNVLVNTYVRRLLSKTKAEEKIKDFLDRVNKVNKLKTYLYYIDQVYLCGEYIKNKDLINKLHFDVKLCSKYKDEEIRRDLESKKCRNSGKQFSNLVEHFLYPQFEVINFLKSGVHNIIITLNRIEDWEEKEIIFTRNI